MKTSPERIVRRRGGLGRWLRTAALAVVLMASLCPAPAFARGKDEKKGPPYDVAGLDSKTQIVPWIFGFAFLGLGLLVGMKNPQRTHT